MDDLYGHVASAGGPLQVQEQGMRTRSKAERKPSQLRTRNAICGEMELVRHR